MQKVLFIAHRFPPIASSGSFRPAKFVKHLPYFGWQPYVISTDQTIGEGIDETLLKNVPPTVQVWRVPTPYLFPLDRLQAWFSRKSRRWNGVNSPGDQVVQREASENHSNALVRNLKRVALAPLSFIQYPPIDTDLYWALRILPLALRLIKKENIEVIFTTSPPWASLLAGLLLHKLTSRPWVVDMRDPWTTDKLRYTVQGWRRIVDARVARVCLQRANAVITVHADWLDDLRRQAGVNGKSERFILITNGYDEDDVPTNALPVLNQDTGITCSFLGSMYQGSLEPLLKALECLEAATLARLRFHLVGYIHPADLGRLEQSPARKSFFHQPQRVSHSQALECMRNSHILLLFLPFDYYPGKIFEYMRIKRPVLAIGPPRLGTELVQQSGIGCVVYRDNIEELTQVLQQIVLDYPGFVRQYYQPNWEVIKQYDRRVLTERLAQVLDSVI